MIRSLGQALAKRPMESLITGLVLLLLAVLATRLLQWAVVDATWFAKNQQGCRSGGACWAFVGARLNQFLFGFYPQDQLWRVGVFAAVAGGLIAGIVVRPGWFSGSWRIAGAALSVPAAELIFLYGGILGVPVVETRLWGGLLLTVVMALSSALIAFPLAVLLALGRRSAMPSIAVFCGAFVEFWRAVPILAVVFLASVLLPLVVPSGVTVDRLLRAVVGLGLVFAAYMAEAIRGGLQAVPKGQGEAAAALGLLPAQTIKLVVLPQALKIALPALTNEFNAIIKNTTLVLVVSLFELLGSVQSALADPNWVGLTNEGYAFAGALFWAMCFGVSRYGAALERRLHWGIVR